MTAPVDAVGVILVGGLGTRMRPLTDHLPKPLLPVGGVPLVLHQVAHLVAAGVREIVLAASRETAPGSTDFAAVLSGAAALGARARLVREPRPLGTGGGLVHALDALDAPDAGRAVDAGLVVLVNGDLLTGHDLAVQLRALPDDADGSLHVRTVPDARPYGCVETERGGRVVAFHEKHPDPPTREVNAGTSVLRRAALDDVPRGEVVSIERDVYPRLAARGRLVVHREGTGPDDQPYFCDVGTPQALVAASVDVVTRGAPRHDTPTGRASVVGAGSTVAAGAAVTGGSALGAGVDVADGAAVDGSVVMDGSSIGAGAAVTASALGRRVQVGAGAELRRCALGDGVVVPDGARWTDRSVGGP